MAKNDEKWGGVWKKYYYRYISNCFIEIESRASFGNLKVYKK